MSEALENKIETAVKEKPYTFRPLEAGDTFLMCSIIKKIGIKEFKSCFEDGGIQALMMQNAQKEGEQSGEKTDLVNVGITVFMELADVIIGNIPKCEKEIFALLSNVSNLTEEEVRKMGFADFFGMIIDFIKKEEFKDFIKVVSTLF